MTALAAWMDAQQQTPYRLSKISGVEIKAVRRARDGKTDMISRKNLWALVGATGLRVDQLLGKRLEGATWTTGIRSLDAQIRTVFRHRYSPDFRSVLMRYFSPECFESWWTANVARLKSTWSICEIVDSAALTDPDQPIIQTRVVRWDHDAVQHIEPQTTVWKLSAPANCGTLQHPVRIIKIFAPDL